MHNAVVQFSLISIRSWWSSLVYYTVICTTFSNCSKTLNILTGGNCSQGILCSARHVMKPNSLLLLIICITLLLMSSSHGSRPHCMMHKGRYFLNCCRSEVIIGIVWLKSHPCHISPPPAAPLPGSHSLPHPEAQRASPSPAWSVPLPVPQRALALRFFCKWQGKAEISHCM